MTKNSWAAIFLYNIKIEPTVTRVSCLKRSNFAHIYMSGFMKTVLKTASTKIAGMFLGNRSDSAHKYGHVVLRHFIRQYCLPSASY